MKRIPALAAGLLALAAGCGPSRPPQPPPQNLLLVTVDSLRADALGAYGQKLRVSPNLDRLAAGGVVFEQCSSSAPSTLPALATLLTGKLPFGHGVRSDVGFALPAGERALAEVFDQHGYRTGAEVANGLVTTRSGLAQGFEDFRDPDSFDARRLQVVSRAGRAARCRSAPPPTSRGERSSSWRPTGTSASSCGSTTPIPAPCMRRRRSTWSGFRRAPITPRCSTPTSIWVRSWRPWRGWDCATGP